MKKVFAWLLGIIALGAIVYGAYAGYEAFGKKQNTYPYQFDQASSSDSITASSSPSDVSASTTELEQFTASSTSVDTSSWQSYQSVGLGYSLSYPADLVQNGSGASLILAFPQSDYFHWPLLDDARITVTVTVASSCPPLTVLAGDLSVPTTTLAVNSYQFIESRADDVAAGNRYEEIAYDTMADGSCYQLDLYDHGANGAALYVNDPGLIAQYDGQHDADISAVESIFDAVVASFRLN